jgi:hypothetical protein
MASPELRMSRHQADFDDTPLPPHGRAPARRHQPADGLQRLRHAHPAQGTRRARGALPHCYERYCRRRSRRCTRARSARRRRRPRCCGPSSATSSACGPTKPESSREARRSQPVDHARPGARLRNPRLPGQRVRQRSRVREGMRSSSAAWRAGAGRGAPVASGIAAESGMTRRDRSRARHAPASRARKREAHGGAPQPVERTTTTSAARRCAPGGGGSASTTGTCCATDTPSARTLGRSHRVVAAGLRSELEQHDPARPPRRRPGPPERAPPPEGQPGRA